MTALDPITLLERYGPEAPDAPAPGLEESRRYVRALADSHYENFSVLSRVVPVAYRDDFAAVYAFCRWSDDLGDETGADEAARRRSLELLGWWRGRLEACLAHARAEPGAEAPSHPVFVALADSIRRRELPSEPFRDLVDAFEQDQRVTRYTTWAQLLDYCARSADPVGRLVLAIGGIRGERAGEDELLRMSDATCSALQLTNFWQDVRRDLLDRDRVYLPLEETGVTDDDLRRWIVRRNEPSVRVAYIRALRPLVEKTEALFAEGRPLPRRLGPDLAPAVWLFGAGGEAVLGSIRRIGCATLWDRPTLTRSRKAALVLAAGLRFPRLLGRAGAAA